MTQTGYHPLPPIVNTLPSSSSYSSSSDGKGKLRQYQPSATGVQIHASTNTPPTISAAPMPSWTRTISIPFKVKCASAKVTRG